MYALFSHIHYGTVTSLLRALLNSYNRATLVKTEDPMHLSLNFHK